MNLSIGLGKRNSVDFSEANNPERKKLGGEVSTSGIGIKPMLHPKHTQQLHENDDRHDVACRRYVQISMSR